MLKFSDLLISPGESLRAAMARMTQNRKGALFVCDEEDHLIGVVSDGDVRRSLLDDAMLVAPIHQMMNTDPVSAESTEEAKAMLDRYGIVAVPVLDASGRIREVVMKDGEGTQVLKRAGAAKKTKSASGKADAVAIIPARGGSKRIARKNLAMVAGKPLIAWAILAAKKAKHIGTILVSSDDPEIAEVARSLGVEVPWMRPKKLAEDHAPTLDVVLHALNEMKHAETKLPEIGILLEPTAPLRQPEHIDQAIELLLGKKADSVVSVSEIPHTLNPEELLVIEKGKIRPYLKSRTMDSRRLRGRQSPVYVQNGLVYAFRTHAVLKHKSLYGQECLPLVLDWKYFFDVDLPEDLPLAEFKLRRIGSKEPGR